MALGKWLKSLASRADQSKHPDEPFSAQGDSQRNGTSETSERKWAWVDQTLLNAGPEESSSKKG